MTPLNREARLWGSTGGPPWVSSGGLDQGARPGGSFVVSTEGLWTRSGTHVASPVEAQAVLYLRGGLQCSKNV